MSAIQPQQAYEQYFPAAASWSSTIFELIEWRKGDVVISSGAKQGSTWMQNILHQLRTGGDDTFAHIEAVCPRPEGVEYPGQSDRERLERWQTHAFSQYPFRVLKTHASPPSLPFHPEVKYIIPVRNGKDTIVSFYHYRNSTTEEFQSLWGGRPQHFPSFDICFDWYLYSQAYWKLINNWLPYRHQQNVLFIHYADLKCDLDSNLTRISDFLNLNLSLEERSRVLTHCSFSWMQQHAQKFEPKVFTQNIPILRKGGMIRRGNLGDRRDWFTPEQETRWDTTHCQLLPDETIRNWCDRGGKL